MATSKKASAKTRGYWFIHSGLAGEIERVFLAHNLIDADVGDDLSLAINRHQWIVRDGDTIRVQAGEGPSDE